MPDSSVSFAGNLTDHPELRRADGGIARATFRMAVSGRNRDSEPSFLTVVVWRDQAEHAAASLSKGSRVVVVDWLQQRAWTAEDGRQRPVAGRGRCRGAGAEPAVGDRHAGQGFQEQRGVAITGHVDQDDAAERRRSWRGEHAGVPLRLPCC
jgi:single-stranded DNA-binding protein